MAQSAPGSGNSCVIRPILREILYTAQKPLLLREVRNAQLWQPDPLRLRYRGELRTLIDHIIRTRLERKTVARHIADWTAANIEDKDSGPFVEIAKTELADLHTGNFARYQIRPSKFEDWQEVWNAR